ncbi:hypothetical protein BDF20DRAFT_838428 [Mycotypha africana]|uniref:uncharacterized protein n=1 Tax=Mycotypha africana TaxID=64632 RepID=UPI002301C196|nr:uncharacterized protein BDF20DRAFT_838428 [Mycotypha africana]KAI8970027.1 hypothetical protein BDF20DRAFT_838428 [Mycotypha africana]
MAMYGQNNASHPDKFAGQYPPPPPLRSPVAEPPSISASTNDIHTDQQAQRNQPQSVNTTTVTATEQHPPYHLNTTVADYPVATDFSNMPNVNSYTNVGTNTAHADHYENIHNNRMSSINYSNSHLPNNNSYPSYSNYATASTPPIQQQQQQQQQQPVLPQPHSEIYLPLTAPPPVLNDYSLQYSSPPQQYYHNPTQPHHQPMLYQNNATTTYDDEKDTSSLDSYLRREREEYLRHDESNNNTKPMAAAMNMTSYEEVPLPVKEEEKRPMVRPHYVRPTPPPENEAESYRYRPAEFKQHRSCCRAFCCCYNPAITCCSFFWLLVSIAFLAAGIALIIASKVVTDKCNSQCLGTQIAANFEQVQSACGTICSKVLHEGMFYGGIVVAGLAAIAILWKIIMWTCAGYSK